ncbi:Rad2 nuclease, partial [Haplosporangium bisporale]
MGLKDWFRFIRRNGYDAVVIHISAMLISMGSRKGRVDVLSFYPVIRNAYSHHAPEKAHSILEQHLMRFGSKSNLILYVDGEPALEKQETAKHRKESREKATIKCKESLDKLEAIIINNVKPRKRHFTDVKTSLASTFCWSSQHRQSFIEYMKQAEWSVRICETEADVAIAVDCQPGDIVISADSDMLAYGSVSTLWRPISKYLVLAYKLADVCQQLGLTRDHLTALAVVSSNDYSRNIYSLGPATNYSIIKSLDAQDTKSIVTAYLRHVTVSTKNTTSETFDAPLRVFVDMKQTPIGLQYASIPDLSYNDLYMRFGDLCSLYEQVKKGRLPEMSTEQPLQLTLTTQNSSSPRELAGHPPLPRTRIPRHRHR